jgi:hypothetical protein
MNLNGFKRNIVIWLNIYLYSFNKVYSYKSYNILQQNTTINFIYYQFYLIKLLIYIMIALKYFTIVNIDT